MATGGGPGTLSRICARIIRHRRHQLFPVQCVSSRRIQATSQCIQLCPSSLGSSPNVESPLLTPVAQPIQPCRTFGEDAVKKPTSVDPYKLMEGSLNNICDNIKQALKVSNERVEEIASYHFDGQGKAFRPLVVLLSAKACNQHTRANQGDLIPSQERVAEIAEMIHVASLVHDDVIDGASLRRGRLSVQAAWGQRQAIMSGVYILAVSSMQLARLRDNEVVQVLSQVLEDLVRGEFMQLGSEEDADERFAHYLRKTFKKTASLIANSCKAVSIISGCSEEMQEIMFQYGRNIGMAFQLVDDLLDFTSTEDLMGKPAAADLKLGLATGPLLFAAQEHPELNALIMRRFSQPGDVDVAWQCVRKSDGISQTRLLAEQHCKEAVRLLARLQDSPEKDGMIALTQKVLNRLK